MIRRPSFKTIVCIAVAAVSNQALAWNPNAGAEPASAYTDPQSTLPNNVVPQRYYSSQGLAPLPPAATYAPQPIYNTAPPKALVSPVSNAVIAPPAPSSTAGYATYQSSGAVAMAPLNSVPINNAVTYPAYGIPAAPQAPLAPIQYAPAPIQAAAIAVQPAPMMVQSPPVPVLSAAIVPAPSASLSYTDPSIENNLMRGSAETKRTRYSVGAELFYDNYQEPETFPDLHSDTYYGSLTGSVAYDITPRWFAALDGRASYGSEDYSSQSGTIKGVPQWELESRVIAGYNGLLSSGSRIKPYIGLGVRYYLDQSEGEVTSLGALGYDRSILQFYAPIGLSYEFEMDGVTIAPTIEVDPLLHGTVESRLGSIAGYSNANNKQTKGMGWRAEIMVSKLRENGTGWQFGPFVRYWNIEDSDEDRIDTPGGPRLAIEPQNTRLQLGTKLKYLF